jgi:iron complex transport system substrate-binding protein
VRIVSLLPSATEICFALGLGDDVVGVTHECDYPPEALAKPKLTRSSLPEHLQTHPGTEPAGLAGRSRAIDRHVKAAVHSGSSLYALDSDLLERLAPDLIITQELCAVCAVSYDVVAQATKRLTTDPRIVSLEPSSLEDVFSTIVTVGGLTGAEGSANRVVGLLRAGVAALRKRTRELARPKTLVLEWTDPPMGGGHWTPELVEVAGGTPVLASAGADSQKLSWEAIAEADPDVILVAPCGYDLATTRSAIAEISAVPEWAGLRAVRAGRSWAIDGSAYVNRPGPRLVRSAEIFARAIHEEAAPGSIPFEDALARAG